MKKIIIPIILVLVVVIVLVIVGGDKEVNYDEFAKCLTEKGAVMYGAYWCSHCQAQKEEFGDSFKFVNYVECTEKKEKCEEKGIQGFPTWIINSEKYPGKQSFSKLSALTGCELPKEV